MPNSLSFHENLTPIMRAEALLHAIFAQASTSIIYIVITKSLVEHATFHTIDVDRTCDDNAAFPNSQLFLYLGTLIAFSDPFELR